MICPGCGAENPAGKRFCSDCGTALAAICAACGAENPPDKRFCGDCGAPLGADGAPAPTAVREAPVAERRLVTVLFADLVGFTPLSESRDAEEVRELLSRYFDIARRLIEVYGGTVEKFIGDAVMAVWGTPVATEDDAERAVRAGLDLIAAVSALGDDAAVPELRARVGVLTGEAAVTLGATSEGMVAGDLVNTAARVQAAAHPGTLLVGDATRRATEQTIVFDDAGEHELKGKAEPVRLWRALRIVAGARGQLKSTGLEAPFVGRDRELRLVKELYHASAEDRKAHLISVNGIAGIGKSRLAWEFYKYFDGIVETVWWHRGRCLSYGEGVTYWALADMVRMRCRIAEDETEETGAEKLRATLDEHILDPDERAFVEQPLLQLLGWGDGQGERHLLFAAWRLFFERLSDTYPVVLVFEDLQWADESLLDFIEYLLEWSRNHPVLVFALSRPELIDRRPTWGAGQRAFTSIYLEALARPAMEGLLDGLVPGMPDAAREQILARAEGVPLYAVETVRMLLDRGLLVQDGASYRIVGEIGALDVPETLHALIAARLDGLDEAERTLVQDAAVLGKTFRSTSLAWLSGKSVDDVERLLAALVRKEVLTIQADPRSPEHGQYGFLQDLVRRVAYETLSRRERKLRHLAAADQIGGAFGEDDVPEVVASHLVAAYEAAGDADDDAAAIKARAGETFVLAGERAERLAAAGEAQRFFEQAAALSDDPHASAALIDRAGRMAWVAGRPDEATALLERARASFDEHGDVVAKALADAKLAEIEFTQGHPPLAAERLTPAFEAIQRVGSPEEIAVLAAQLGRFLVFTQQYDRAAPLLEQALSLAEELDLPETYVQALNSKSVLLLYVDRPRESRLLVEGALAAALEHDLHEPALRAFNNVVAQSWSDEAFEESLETIDRALAYARRIGDRQWETSFLAGSAGGLEMLGRWDEALRRVDEAESHSPTVFVRGLMLWTVVIHLHRGERDLARSVLERNAEVASSENPEFACAYALISAQLQAAEGQVEQAVETVARALGDFHRGAATWLPFIGLEVGAETMDERLIRRLLLATEEYGQQASRGTRAQWARLRARLPEHDAIAELGEAERLFRELEASFYIACVQAERAEHLLAAGRRDEAEPLLAEAREVFERLRATPWLARVDAPGGVAASAASA